MASQAVQGWHPNPQLMQPSQQAPQGWTGSWPPGGNVAFPPGYPGPPPVPGGAVTHPRWNAGYWQYNPLANVQNPQQPWAPGVGWFPPNFNPYKRVPKPPSPSYWNTKLTDNGLGLEGMVKRKDPSEYDGEDPPTPWIWNPPSLLESKNRATPTRDFNPRRTGSVDPSLHNTSTPTRDHAQSSRRSSQDGPSAQSGGLAGPSTSSQRSIGQTDSWSSRTRSQPPPASEVPPFPAPTPTNPTSRSASAQQTVFTQEPESFTSKGELHPTFSSSIIRTPTHYQQSRRSMEEPVSNYRSRSPSSAANFTEDLSSSLNANTSSRTWSSSTSGPLSRSRTEPVVASLTTIQESSSSLSSGEIFLPPLRDLASSSSADSSPDPSPRRRDRRPSPYASSDLHSPEPSPLYRDRRPSPYATRHSNSHSHSPSPSPHAHTRDAYGGNNNTGSGSVPGSRRDNPLPPPPVERASLEMSRPPVQEPSPPRYARKVRVGFWNKRGDHLTPSSYVVYAPHNLAYPEDLRDHPDEREGYRDHYGSFAPWRQDRPELPASLPYHGRPPAQPYESFVVYTYFQ